MRHFSHHLRRGILKKFGCLILIKKCGGFFARGFSLWPVKVVQLSFWAVSCSHNTFWRQWQWAPIFQFWRLTHDWPLFGTRARCGAFFGLIAGISHVFWCALSNRRAFGWGGGFFTLCWGRWRMCKAQLFRLGTFGLLIAGGQVIFGGAILPFRDTDWRQWQRTSVFRLWDVFHLANFHSSGTTWLLAWPWTLLSINLNKFWHTLPFRRACVAVFLCWWGRGSRSRRFEAKLLCFLTFRLAIIMGCSQTNDHQGT